MSQTTVVELDLVGYSDLGRTLEENLGVKVVAEFNSQIQDFVTRSLVTVGAERRDVVLATTGDGAILGFGSPLDAHNFAVALHLDAQAHNSVRTMQMAHRWFRVGIATGDLHREGVGKDGPTIAGKVIIDAVRLEAAASPGQIVSDLLTLASLPSAIRSLYGEEEVVTGKRNEKFRVRKYSVIPFPLQSEASSVDSRRTLISNSGDHHKSLAVPAPLWKQELLLFGFLKQIRWRVFLGVLITMLLAGVALVLPVRQWLRSKIVSNTEKHIAVLPFDFVGNDAETMALGDGLMDSISGKLSNLDIANQSLWVVPAVEVRRRHVSDPKAALREFGATIVLKATFERHDRVAHLSMALIDSQNMREIGYSDIEGQTTDLAAFQNAAIFRISRILHITSTSDLALSGTEKVAHGAYEDYLLALGYIQRFDKPGNLDRALASLQEAVSIDGAFALALARISQVYILKYQMDRDTRWLEEAGRYSEQAIKLDNRIPLAHVAFARVQQHMGHHEIAVQELQHAVDLDPRDAEALTGLAGIYESIGHTSEAEAAYTKAANLRPDDWTGYNNLGNFYSQIGKPIDAVAQFRHALELTPDNSGVLANLGGAYLDSGDPKMATDAERAFERSILINPTYEAYANLANLFGVQHRFRDSVIASTKALELNDHNYNVWNNLAEAYEWMEDKDKADSARNRAQVLVEKALSVNPQDAEAHANCAVLLAKKGKKDGALRHINIAIALSPNDQAVLSDVADSYELLGNRELALRYISESIAKGLPPEQLAADPYIRGTIADPDFHIPMKSNLTQRN